MASSTRASAGAPDLVKWAFAGLIVLSLLVVLWIDERFWIDPASPHWKHVAPVMPMLLPIHGLAGLTALVTGALQMSSRVRSRTALHRTLGKVYIGAVCVSAPIAIFMGVSPLEPATMHVEQIFQGGLWLISALVASGTASWA